MVVTVRSLSPREQRERIPCVAPQIVRALEADRGQEQQRQVQLLRADFLVKKPN